MDSRYEEWIREYERRQMERLPATSIYPLPVSCGEHASIAVRGMCACAVDEMVEAFPELRKVRGHYGYSPHWWCKALDGTVVDPTAKQFWPGDAYREYTGPDPLGKCMNCGDLVWSTEFTSSACSSECLVELQAEYGLPMERGKSG